MTHPVTFLSHTSRERAPHEMPPGVSHQAHVHRKRFLRMLIPKLAERIRAGGGDVWVDSEQVEPSDEFAGLINLGIAYTSSAVVLIDEDALYSDYMAKEVTLLSWRHAIEPGFRVLPVLLGQVTPKTLKDSRLGEVGSLPDLSPVLAVSRKRNAQAAAAIAEQIAEEVVQFRPGTPVVANWVRTFAGRIGDAPDAAVIEALTLLGVERGSRGHTVADRREVLAAALFNAPLEAAFKAVRAVAAGLGTHARRDVVELVEPLWVDLDAAVRLRQVGERDARKRVVGVATNDMRQAGHAVARGTVDDGGHPPVRLLTVAGEDQVPEIVKDLDDTLRRVLLIGHDEPPHEIAQWLREFDVLVFALLRCDLLPRAVARGVLQELVRRFPGVVFVAVADTPRGQNIRGRPIVLTSDADHARRARWFTRSLGLIKGDMDHDSELTDRTR